MGEKTLVEGLITESITLVKHLDKSGKNPEFAAWYYYEDAVEWRLLLSGSYFDQYLPNQEAIAYQKISESISASDLHSLSISLVKIIETKGSLPQALSFLVGTPEKGIIQANFTDTTLNGIFIKDMIVLRSAIKKRA